MGRTVPRPRAYPCVMRSMAKRSILSTLALAATLVVAGGATAGAADEESGPWQQNRYRATHNAVITSGVDEVYTGELSTSDEVRATPTITDGKIFVGNHSTGDLQAFDLSSGEQLWNSQAPNWVHSEMVYRDGSVFVGYGNRFMAEDGVRGTEDSGVLGLDADTGEILWQFDTEGEVMPTPVVVGDSVYAATGDRHLYEIDPETGEGVERAELGGNVNMSAPSVADDMIYVGASGDSPNVLTAYDTETDEVAWQREFPTTRSMGDVPPAVADGIVVITATVTLPEDSFEDGFHERHMIFAVDAETGELLWKDDLGEAPKIVNNRSGEPTIHDGTIFVGSPTTKISYAYDLRSGERLWTYHTGAVKGGPVVDDGVAYFATTSGWIHALDEATGEKVGELHLGGALSPSGPVIVDDVLVAGSQDGNVYLTPISKILDEELDEELDEQTTAPPLAVGLALGLGALVLILIAVVLLQARQLRRMRSARH